MSERGAQMRGNGSCVLVLHSSGRQISLVVRFIYKIVYRLSAFIRCCIKHFCMFLTVWWVEIDWCTCLPPFPCISGTAGIVHQKCQKGESRNYAFISEQKCGKVFAVLYPCLTISPLWYLGVSNMPTTTIFGCCHKQLFQVQYKDAVCLYLFLLFPRF